DTIYGGKGRDTYIFNKGDGVDTIYDDDSGPDKSIMVLGEGIDKNSIKLRKGSLLLDLGDGDAIHIANFDYENPLATQSFASFQFADGSSLTWNELLAREAGRRLRESRRWRYGGRCLQMRKSGVERRGA
ncbi:MAG: outer membrane adhesin-like protein, partial [Rhodocyclaceae bacterium]